MIKKLVVGETYTLREEFAPYGYLKATDAKACYKVNQLVLVNLDILDAYLETFRITDEDFYK